jgi:hypothetical protein
MAIAGRVAIVPKGDWSAETEYKRLDEVTYNNTMFIAKKAVPKGTLPTNAEYWSKSIVGSAVTVDTDLSSTSTNPVQNKVIKAYVDKKASENVDFSTSTSKILNGTIEAPLVLNKATRNLLPYPYNVASGTISHGVTMTYTKEGTISLDGTMPEGNKSQPGFELCGHVENLFDNHINTLYAKYDTTIPRILHTFFQIFKKTTWVANVETLSKNDYNWAEYTCNYAIQYYKTSGDVHGTVSNIRMVTDADDPFVPYSGYDIKTIGKNLIPYPYFYGSSHNEQGITFTIDSNGVIHASGTATATAYYILFKNSLLPCLAVGNKYTMTLTVKNGDASIYLANAKNGNTDIAVIRHLSNGTKSTTFTFTRIDGATDIIGLYITSGTTLTDCQIQVQLEEGEKATDIEQYQTSTTKITKGTEFPITGLKSFDGITNIVSPGNVKVTYAKSEIGAVILNTSENKLDKDDIVNNQTTTEEGFALDARQANPNVKGSLGAQIKAINDMLNTKKIPSFAIENIFTGNPFCIVSGTTDLASFSGTKWEPDNGGYHVENIKYPAGGQVNATVNFTLTAHSIVIIDVNTLNSEKIEVQGSCISYNFTDSPKNGNISIQFAGRDENTTTSTIRYMPLVIHLA